MCTVCLYAYIVCVCVCERARIADVTMHMHAHGLEPRHARSLAPFIVHRTNITPLQQLVWR